MKTRKYYQTGCNDRMNREIHEADKIELNGIARIWIGKVIFKEGEFLVLYEDDTVDPLKDVAHECLILERFPHYEKL